MISSQITFKQLEAFVQVVERGTFRRAAAALGTTQPNISARIGALETTLDSLLLHRDAGSVRLTQAGARLLPAAREVLRAGEAFLETARRRDLIADRMRLGVTELIACTWLQVFLRACREAYPAVKVELRVDLGREIDRELAAGELDLALQTGPFSDAADCVQPLGRHRYAWVARPEVARALGPAPDYAAIFDRTVLTHARHTEAAAALDRFSRDRGLAVEQIVHSSSLASCLPMAVDGVGVALLPKALVAEALAARQLAMLECDWLPDPLEDFARYDSARAAGFIGQAAEMAVRVAREAAEYQEN